MRVTTNYMMVCNKAKKCPEESCTYRVPHVINDDCEIDCADGGHCVPCDAEGNQNVK